MKFPVHLFPGLLLASMLCSAAELPRLAVYLVLEGEPTAQTVLHSKSFPNAAAAQAALQAREAEIQGRQRELEAKLSELGLKPSGRFRRLANVLRVHVSPTQIAELEKLPGVTRVARVPTYTLQTATSVPFIGATRVWTGILSARATGEGIRMGIIDTGIDYLHANFGGSGSVQAYLNNNPSLIEPGTFPTPKVAGGYDFAGNTYTGDNTPSPDPDPLDCAGNGHGSHVAGIAAGFGVLTNGTTFSGTYTQGLDVARFIIGPGVAPQARLYALKIFGCSGSTQLLLDALEWASDPNNDGDFSDRLDVVNLSLGAAFGFTGAGDPDQDAVNRLVDLGCVVVAGAGNNGNVLYSTFSPATAEKCLSVGSSIDAGHNPALRVISPELTPDLFEAVEGLITRSLAQTGPVQAPVVYAEPPLACENLTNGGQLNGRIALMDRGTCTFVDKIRRAESNGALAVIMVNNVPGEPVAMGGLVLNIQIPSLMISQSDGDILKSRLNSNLVVRLDPSLVFPNSLADRLSGSSARGPASPDSLLKPEIVAPGQDIFSTEAGSGTNGTLKSGTSMSSPHVAGAAALLRQLHPDWPPQDIKAALMNTARPTRNGDGLLYPESWTGAGRLQVDQAARAIVTAWAEDSGGLVSLSFGSLVLTNLYTEIRGIRLTNHGNQPITYSIAVSNTVSENGFRLTPLAGAVTVPARGAALVEVELTADPRQFDRSGDQVSAPFINGLPRSNLYEASGQIWFHHTNLSLHLSYYGNLRAGSSYRVTANQAGPPSGMGSLEVAIPMAGDAAHPAPIVSAFQLGVTSADQHLAQPWRAVADLLAVGAATDAHSQTQFSRSTIYFGIAAAGNWTTPQSFVAQYDVLIDVNRDGTEDFRVFNSSQGNATNNIADADFANDAFLAVVQDLATGIFFTNHLVNFFAPAEQDTAPFNNNVIVLPVPVSLLGITAANPAFNYRVRTRIPRERGAFVLETTPSILFDAMRPALDTTTRGLNGTPFHRDGQPLVIGVDPTAAAAHGFTATAGPELLLLHHSNVTGQRIDRVVIELTSVRLAAIRLVGVDVRLRFTTVAGRRYRLERSDRLAGPLWISVVDTIAGTGGAVETVDLGGARQPARFYRVRLLP